MAPRRTLLIAVALGVGLAAGSTGATIVSAQSLTPANCVGQHVSMMAREHGGMADATAHHNGMHGTDLTVREHQAHIRAMCPMGDMR